MCIFIFYLFASVALRQVSFFACLNVSPFKYRAKPENRQNEILSDFYILVCAAVFNTASGSRRENHQNQFTVLTRANLMIFPVFVCLYPFWNTSVTSPSRSLSSSSCIIALWKLGSNLSPTSPNVSTPSF